MALLYRAQLTPAKPQLLTRWLPGQPWAAGLDTSGLEILGNYRFDDPAGQVGIDNHLIGIGSRKNRRLLHVPLTYRPEPLVGMEAHLVGVTEHSVLGTRYVYDGCADPVAQQAFLTAIFTGGVQAEMDVATDPRADDVDAGEQGRTVRRELTTLVQGSGIASSAPEVGDGGEVLESDPDRTVLRFAGAELTVLRRIASDPEASETFGADDDETLLGTWPGRDVPTLLAYARKSF